MLVNIHKQKLILLLILSVIFSNSAQTQVWTLKQCIDTAKVHYKTLQISRNAMQMSEQKHKEAWANLIPKVTAVADYKYYADLPYQLIPMTMFGGKEGLFKATQFGVPHNINANLQLSIPLYNPQLYGAIKTTGIAEEISELQYRKSEEQVFFEISNLYYNAQILHHQMRFIDSNIVNTQKLYENMKLLKEQLLAKETDVAKVYLQFQQLTTQKELISAKFQQVINALKFSMGLPISNTIEIDTNIEKRTPADYTGSNNVDIQLAGVQNRLFTSELNTLKSSRLPSVSLYGTYGKIGYGYKGQPENFLKFYSIGFVGAQISFPLFNGTVTNRKINQKKIEVQNSKLQIELITEQNTMQIDNAKRQLSVSLKSIENMQLQINLAQNVYKNTLLQQKEGTATLTDVLLADNALREAQQNYLNAVIDFLKADLELKKLTGNIK